MSSQRPAGQPLWKWTSSPEQLTQGTAHAMGGHIGLKITEVGPDYLVGTLPVDRRTMQPFGRLHGGANVALAEELGSLAANMCMDPEQCFGVGLEINANHLKGVTSGIVTGTARPLHVGRSTQVWEIRIVDEAGDLACISRLTVAVVAKRK